MAEKARRLDASIAQQRLRDTECQTRRNLRSATAKRQKAVHVSGNADYGERFRDFDAPNCSGAKRAGGGIFLEREKSARENELLFP